MGRKNRLMPNYGWVQNTSNLSTIRDTVDLVPDYGIDHSSLMNIIKSFRESNGNLPKRWSWDARCRIKGIHALGFVELDRNMQGYVLTDLGRRLQKSKKSTKFFNGKRVLTNEEIEIFKYGLLTNPPVVRVLELLNKERHSSNKGMSKYDIGAQLGFVGDRGFTHYDPEWIVINGYSFNKKEGDADKWARTILSWLCQVGWAYKLEKRQDVLGKKLLLFSVKPEVDKILRYDSKRIIKSVPSEMLCSDHHAFPKLIQKRRSILLDALSKETVTIKKLVQYLSQNGIEADEDIVKFEIISLEQAGFRIAFDGGYYKLEDKIKLDIDPNLFQTKSEEKSSIEELIERLVVQYSLTLPPRIVDNLIRFGYDGSKAKEFESAVYAFFKCIGYRTTLLGQGKGRVADVIIRYIDKLYAKSYGVIIDAKATSTRYSFPASDVRKMKEYIELHGGDLLSEKIPHHAFAFVSSEFIENVEQPLEEIYRDKGIRGTAIKVLTLLELGSFISQGYLKLSDLYDKYTTNSLFKIN